MKIMKDIEKLKRRSVKLGYAVLWGSRFGGEQQLMLNQLIKEGLGVQHIAVLMCGYGFMCGLMANRKDLFKILIRAMRD